MGSGDAKKDIVRVQGGLHSVAHEIENVIHRGIGDLLHSVIGDIGDIDTELTCRPRRRRRRWRKKWRR